MEAFRYEPIGVPGTTVGGQICYIFLNLDGKPTLRGRSIPCFQLHKAYLEERAICDLEVKVHGRKDDEIRRNPSILTDSVAEGWSKAGSW
ncbi:MAG TPA: hypothetical protein EYP17_05370 [Candidatus Latescibacteria bacterium]|nr:hypothetical protein [Candidatus Latescibacterota bacterium]